MFFFYPARNRKTISITASVTAIEKSASRMSCFFLSVMVKSSQAEPRNSRQMRKRRKMPKFPPNDRSKILSFFKSPFLKH